MAFYVPHAQQPAPAAKAKIEGFQSANGQHNNPPSPTNTFDPSSLFFSGPIFPDAFRHPNAGNASMDFTDSLLSMMPPNGQDRNQQQQHPNGQQQQQQHHQQQQQQQQQQGQNGGPPLNLNIFDMSSHFPNHHFQQQAHRHTPTRDDSLDSPASLQTTQSFFSDAHSQQQHGHFVAPSSIPSYLNNVNRPDTPGTSVIGSPSEPSATSPFPTHAAHARIHGHRSPSIGPNSHSRSRSRGGTSKPPPASRNGIVKASGAGAGPKRTSISSTPEETVTGLPGPPSRPQAILIPSQQQQQQPQQQQHQYTSHGLNSIGPHPISPLGIHSTQTAPSAWFVPSNTGGGVNGTTPTNQNPNPPTAGEPGSFGIQHPDVQQSFGQAFQPRSLSLGTSPKPGTSASASVLAGSLGTGGVGKDAAMDAASKQAAILNEKRRRRRESHNAVERRRRDNINEKISELSTLLPECLLDPSGSASGSNPIIPTTPEGLLPTPGGTALATEDADGKETPAMKANKGIILRKSVEYIRYLQQLVRAQASRNRELESQLSHYRGGTEMDVSSNNLNNASSNSMDPNSANNFGGMLESLTGIDEDGMSGLILANLSPEDTTSYAYTPTHLSKVPEASPQSRGSDEEEERGRGVVRGRRGYGGTSSVSVGKARASATTLLGVRDDSAELESAVSDGESRERMMD